MGNLSVLWAFLLFGGLALADPHHYYRRYYQTLEQPKKVTTHSSPKYFSSHKTPQIPQRRRTAATRFYYKPISNNVYYKERLPATPRPQSQVYYKPVNPTSFSQQQQQNRAAAVVRPMTRLHYYQQRPQVKYYKTAPTKVANLRGETPEMAISGALSPEELQLLSDPLVSLFLPASGQNAAKKAKSGPSVVEVAERSRNLSTFVKLVKKFNLDEELSQELDVTLLAPNDAAFLLLDDVDKLTENDVKRHIIGAALKAENIETGPAFTLSQDTLQFDRKSSTSKLSVEFGKKKANLVQTNIQAGNGVIHVLDQVLTKF